jgi:hypothetical protein
MSVFRSLLGVNRTYRRQPHFGSEDIANAFGAARPMTIKQSNRLKLPCPLRDGRPIIGASEVRTLAIRTR